MKMKLFLLCGFVTFAGVFCQIESGTSSLVSDLISTTPRYTFSGLWNTTGKITVVLPKCCPMGLAVGTGNCSEVSVDFQPSFDVHDHNETAFDDVPIEPEHITFKTFVHNPCKGKKFPLSPDESPKILMNGSLLLAGMGEYDGILGHDQFCIDNLDDPAVPNDTTVYAFVCVKEQKDGYPQWVFSTYITLITISALMFCSSAVFFHRQEVHSVQKRSFMAYALSMTGTYFTIILIQLISGVCKLLGFLLQFCIVLSFAWLAILCIDLAFRIRDYKTKDNGNRFPMYMACSFGFSATFLLISLFHLTPDIPSSFFKPQFQKTECAGFDGDQYTVFFYAAVTSTMITSAICLIYSLIKMNENRYRNTTEGANQWKRQSKKFRYMYGRKLIIFVTMLIWFLDSFSDRFPTSSGISVVILFIQAFHGFIVVPLYTMTTIRKVININQKPRIENLNDLMEIGKSYDKVDC